MLSEEIPVPPRSEGQQFERDIYGQFDSQLAIVSSVIPEVNEQHDAIRQEGRQLIDQYGLKADFFDDMARVTIFSAIARRIHTARAIESTQEVINEAFLIDDMMAVLTADYRTKNFGDIYTEKRASLPEKELEDVLDRYTDNNLSAELTRAVEAGLFDGVRERMQITKEDEVPYRIRVLSIGGDVSTTYGIWTAVYETDSTKSRAENERHFAEADIERSLLREQLKILNKRAKDFFTEIHSEHGVVPAFAYMPKEGMPQLCIAAPIAEKVLNPDITRGAPFYKDKHRADDIAILEHEYAHTQGRLDIGSGVQIGIGLEELKAEYFSGDRHGYIDMKMFLEDMADITGFSIYDFFNRHPRGGNPTEIFSTLATRVGLSAMLDIVFTAPDGGYRTKRLTAIHRRQGGYDGILEKLLQKSIERGDDGGAEERINRRVEWLDQRDATMTDATLELKKNLGLRFVSNIVRDRLRYKRKYPSG